MRGYFLDCPDAFFKRPRFYEPRCELAATTTAIVMGVLAAAGAATSAVGQYSASQAQKASAQFNQQVATNNAQAAAQQAAAEANMQRSRMDRLRGAQVASLSKSGVSGGAAGDIIYDSSQQGELDALMTMYRGSVASGVQRSQAQLYGSQAGWAQTQGIFAAGGTALSGVGSAALTYSAIRNQTPDFGY